MECSSGKNFVSVEGWFLDPLTVSAFTVMGWHLLSPMVLRCDDFVSEQTFLLLVILVKGSEAESLYGNMDPEIFCTWGGL